MPTPMDPTSAGFLFAENRSQPMHVGGLQLFRKPEGAGRTFVKDLFDDMLTHDDPAPLFRKRPHRSVSTAGLGQRPRAQHAAFLEPQVEVVPWLVVLVQHEGGPPDSLLAHAPILPVGLPVGAAS